MSLKCLFPRVGLSGELDLACGGTPGRVTQWVSGSPPTPDPDLGTHPLLTLTAHPLLTLTWRPTHS